MKRLFKSFAFWFLIISILKIYMHQIGQDSKSIVLIYLNPVLKIISRSDTGRAFMNSGLQVSSRTILGHTSIYWYIGSVVTFIIYGLILDGFRYFLRHICNTTK
ncbi:hypothetical protein KQI86_08425 [Clostridium sp. MSJ-11]|uniref:Uncharacterized protein n=1 Tax=Clostridium mobile TaxID=2841512 RepID=A0ABS6EGL5_9CLOT|nr:hypothetical protein [Clostridium mobile]MBU5484352.1 hypothetical protein [Clostridium mobile]